MNPEFIALTHASRSGGSYKATIPVSIVRDLWNMGDKNSVSICFFIDEGRRVFVVPLEDVLTDFPREVRERVVEEWAKQALKGFPRDSFEKLTKKLARGEIDERIFLNEVERFFERMTSKVRRDLRHIRGSLRFTDEIGGILISSVVAEEEELNEIVEAVRTLVNRRRELVEMLELLQSADIDRDLKEIILGWLSARIEVIDERISQIGGILNEG